MTEPAKITTERRGHVLHVGLNRPAKMNAFDGEMLRQLGAAFDLLEADDDLRCGLVFAHGEHFTAGLDLANVGPELTEGRLDLGGGIDPWAIRGKVRTKPFVSAVRGRCLTIGIETVLASDVCVAASNARFAQIEIKRGIFPFGGATFRLVERAGWGNAMRYLLTGDEFDAAEAHRIGLVQEVTEPGQEVARAAAIAETIAAQAPRGVRATLASARAWLDERAAADALAPVILELMKSEDAAEGLKSFLERRAARFSGT
ncbi:MAG: crotonase/enoyl-CoA hydratase family protein [Polyangiaceae bacterium]